MPSLDPKSLSTSKLHSYLLSAVAPRPIAFASTISVNGEVNLAPFSFFNVFSANPPIVVFSPVLREKNNAEKHTLKNIKATKEAVINVVNFDMVHQTSLSSADFPEGVNEFEKSGLTMLKSVVVKPFRVAESPIQLECKVTDIIALGTEGGAGNLVICEVLKIHIDDEVLNTDGSINQEKLDLVARAGGNYYSRAKKGFFEIPKPAANLGIGVANFPDDIKNSMVLTGNDLGLLGTIEKLPSKNEVKTFIKNISERYPNIQTASHREKHKLARNYLSFGDVESAWKLLLS
jgi:flavin reductase (DIM6/NTAB) family NADH-FMN oxidoreductase RutF